MLLYNLVLLFWALATTNSINVQKISKNENQVAKKNLFTRSTESSLATRKSNIVQLNEFFNLNDVSANMENNWRKNETKTSKNTVFQSKGQDHEEPRIADNFFLLSSLFSKSGRELTVQRRARRDLAGTRDRFGRRQSMYGPNQNMLFPVDLNDYLHIYSISTETFFLNGSANITYKSNGNLRILFDYTIVGDVNVSIDVIRPNYQSAFQTHQDPESIPLQKPRNCHLQIEEKDNVTATQCNLKQKNAKLKKFRDANSFDGDLIISNSTLHNTSTTSEETKKTNSTSSRLCSFPAVKFKKDWLCVNPTSFPCFSVLIQGQDYKITEKICINQPLFKSTFGIGKLNR